MYKNLIFSADATGDRVGLAITQSLTLTGLLQVTLRKNNILCCLLLGGDNYRHRGADAVKIAQNRNVLRLLVGCSTISRSHQSIDVGRTYPRI